MYRQLCVRARMSQQGAVQAWTLASCLLWAALSLFLSALPAGVGAEEPPITESTVSHRPDVFERLWKIYPNKSDKAGAIAAWDTLKVTEEELFKMRVAYPRWRFSSEWMKEEGRHVPPLAIWLGERMWEKEPPPQAPPTAAELSSFLIQPLYLAPRVAYAITGSLVGGLVYPFHQAAAGKVWDSSLNGPWVWHEFVGNLQRD